MSVSAAYQDQSQTPDVSFEIIPLKKIYKPGEPISVRLVLTNHGKVPVSVERFSPLCSSNFYAFVELTILDGKGRNSLKGGCAGDALFIHELIEREVTQVGKTDYWVKLDSGDFYGRETTREVATKKGSYTIKGYFLPARFDATNRNALAERGITILSGQINAADVHISVR